MSLTPEQATALVSGLVAVVLGFLEVLRRKLAENTAKTEQIQKQTNGERERLIAENQKLTAVLAMHRNVLRYVKSTEAGADLLRTYADQHRVVVRDDAIEALERRLTGEDAPS